MEYADGTISSREPHRAPIENDDGASNIEAHWLKGRATAPPHRFTAKKSQLHSESQQPVSATDPKVSFACLLVSSAGGEGVSLGKIVTECTLTATGLRGCQPQACR